MSTASRSFQRRQALDKEIKDLYLKFTTGASTAATATLDLTADIVLTSVSALESRNTTTFTSQVAAAAANPTDTILAAFTGTAAAITATITPNDGTNNPANAAAVGTLDLTADIVLTSVALGAGRNTNTFTLEVEAAAANPTDTILADFTGTAAAIICTITPNDGTNNGAVPVDLTTAELRELITTGAVVGKTVTITDASGLRNDQTATGGGATALAAGGEGDGVVATFSGGTTVAVNLTTAQFRELITTGAVVGKNVTVTDASSLRALQTATGGGAQNMADGGEGDGVVGTFSGAAVAAPSIVANSGVGIASVSRSGIGDYLVTLQDAYVAIRNANAMAISSSAQDLMFQLKSADPTSAAKTVRILARAGAAPVDPTSGTVIMAKFELKNSSV